jgi:predicted MFS family arabinose efflux permease
VEAIRSRAIAPVCATTVVLVIGHFAAYTYLTPLVRSNGGLDGFALSALLFGWGAAGLLGNVLGGRLVDRRPGAVMTGSLFMITAGLVMLTLVPGPAATVAAVLVWALGFSAVPVTLQTVILRVAPHAKDTASAVYVVAFQIGIGGGALIGERLVAADLLGVLPVIGATVAMAAAVIVLRFRDTFPLRATDPGQRLPEPAPVG